MTNLEAIVSVLSRGGEMAIWDLRLEVMKLTGVMCSETGLSAQCRDLRKSGIDIQGRYLINDQGKKTKSYVYRLARPQAVTVEEAERILNA